MLLGGMEIKTNLSPRSSKNHISPKSLLTEAIDISIANSARNSPIGSTNSSTTGSTIGSTTGSTTDSTTGSPNSSTTKKLIPAFVPFSSNQKNELNYVKSIKQPTTRESDPIPILPTANYSDNFNDSNILKDHNKTISGKDKLNNKIIILENINYKLTIDNNNLMNKINNKNDIIVKLHKKIDGLKEEIERLKNLKNKSFFN